MTRKGGGRYWLTPPELDYLRHGRFDPTPYPHAFGDSNALLHPWKKPWYCNPPFKIATRFVRKAIAEGGPGILVIPVTTPTHLLLEAGAILKPLGRVRWLEVNTKKPMPNAVFCVSAELGGGRESGVKQQKVEADAQTHAVRATAAANPAPCPILPTQTKGHKDPFLREHDERIRELEAELAETVEDVHAALRLHREDEARVKELEDDLREVGKRLKDTERVASMALQSIPLSVSERREKAREREAESALQKALHARESRSTAKSTE